MTKRLDPIAAMLGIFMSAILPLAVSAQPEDVPDVQPEPPSAVRTFAVGAAGAVRGNGVLPEAHGWVLVTDRSARKPVGDAEPDAHKGALLIHLPPRQAGTHGGTPGIGRRSRFFAVQPIGIAAAGRRVFVLAENTPDDEGNQRYIVRSIDARPTPVEGMWHDLPAGRMESLPPLKALADAIGFAATDTGPAVLLRQDGELSLAEFTESEWQTSPISKQLANSLGPDPVLLSTPDDLAIVGRVTLIADRARTDAPGANPLAWQVHKVKIPAGGRPVGIFGSSVIAWVPSVGEDPAIIAICSDDGTETIGLPALGGNVLDIGITVIPDISGRLSLLTSEREPDSQIIKYRLVEVSLSTGSILYTGTMKPVTAVTAAEFKTLAAAMVVMMVVSLMVVLRPVPGENEIIVPEGCALATPGRRFVATILDVAVCAMIVSRFSGVPVGDILTAKVLLAPDQSWITLPALIGVGLVYSTLSETILSATLGKLIVGCRVARAQSKPGEPKGLGFFRSLLRNSVKWILPPAASLALLEPTGRHRGDLLAGAVVVVRAEPTEQNPQG